LGFFLGTWIPGKKVNMGDVCYVEGGFFWPGTPSFEKRLRGLLFSLLWITHGHMWYVWFSGSYITNALYNYLGIQVTLMSIQKHSDVLRGILSIGQQWCGYQRGRGNAER
jgi:hypothetical protein